MGQDSGGLPHYTAELANAVSKHEEVTVLKPTDTSGDGVLNSRVNVINAFKPTNISMQNIFNFDLDIKQDVAGLYSFKNISIIDEIDPDIVHDPTDEFPQVSLFSYLYNVYKDRPYVVTSHEVDHGSSDGLLKIADLVFAAVPDFHKDAAVVHSEKQRNALAAKGRDIGSIHVIPHGVYTFFNEFDYREREERQNHALFFGSLIPPKGIQFLIEAVPHVVAEIPDFTLTIAGSGTIPSKCEETMREYKSHITVRNEFIPNDEVGALFTQAQVVVLPYRKGWQTGHSGTLSVAFAFGKPVVASAVGSFPELVEDSGAGLVAQPEDPVSIAEKIVDVLSDQQRRERMKQSSEAVAQELSWENIGQKHIEMYNEIL